MKLKLDENLGRSAARVLAEAGHEVLTVAQQELQSAEDFELAAVCRRESLCLVTLDLGFSNPLVFPPRQYPGIAVLRPRARPSHAGVVACVRTLARALERDRIAGSLWIAEASRVRIHRSSE